MNIIKISNTLDINPNLIPILQSIKTDVIVIAIVGKTVKQVEKYITDLTKIKVTLQGLTLHQHDKYIIVGAAMDQFPTPLIPLQLLYYVAAYQHFAIDSDAELDELLKHYSKVPLHLWRKLMKHSPKLPEKQCKIALFRPTKHNKLAGKPKLIGGYPMRGYMLLDIILNYCDYYNTNKSCIDLQFAQNAYKREFSKRLESVNGIYIQSMQALQEHSQEQSNSDKLLLDSEDLEMRHRSLLQGILSLILELNPIELGPKKELINKIQDDYERLVVQNSEESREYCSELMSSFKQLFIEESSNIEQMVQNRDIYIKEKSSQFEEILNSYLKEAIGPYKYRTVADIVPSLLFELFDQWFEGLNAHYVSDLNRNKAQLLQAQDNMNVLQNRYSEMESKKFDLENQNQSLYFDLESQKREVEKQLKLKELQEEISDRQLKELRHKYDSCKQKKKEYKEKYEKAQSQLRQDNLDLQEKKKELVSYLRKIELLEKALETTIQKQSRTSIDSVGSLQEELIGLMKQFKDNLQMAEHQIRAQRESFQSMDGSRVSQSDSRYYIKQLDKMTQKYDKLKLRHKELENEKQLLGEANDKLKQSYQEQCLTVKQLEIQIKANDVNTRDIIDQLDSNESKIVKDNAQRNNDFMQVLLNHKEQIENLNQEITNLQNNYYAKSMQNSDLSFQNQNLLTVLREALKFVSKKQNTLQSLLKSMPQNQQNEIKEAAAQAGVKL